MTFDAQCTPAHSFGMLGRSTGTCGLLLPQYVPFDTLDCVSLVFSSSKTGDIFSFLLERK